MAKHKKWFSNYPLTEQVHMAMPAAREMIQEGIHSYLRRRESTEERVFELVERYSAYQAEIADFVGKQLDNDQRSFVSDLIAAALALGLAQGLLLRPDALTEGGAR